MRIGTDPEPGATTGPTATYHVYDVRSGVIVATHLFSGVAPEPEEFRLAKILREAHQDSDLPREHLEVLTNAHGMRNNVVKMARLKHELKAAPACAYYFTWQTQILDGVAGAWHTAELQFCFGNTKRCEQGTGNTQEAHALANKMASSWAAFAATGNPSITGLTWAATASETNETMIWDNECRMVDDPDGEARKIILT